MPLAVSDLFEPTRTHGPPRPRPLPRQPLLPRPDASRHPRRPRKPTLTSSSACEDGKRSSAPFPSSRPPGIANRSPLAKGAGKREVTALIGLRRGPSASSEEHPRDDHGRWTEKHGGDGGSGQEENSGIRALGDARNRPVPPIPDRETVLADLLKRVPALTRERAIEKLEAMGL